MIKKLFLLMTFVSSTFLLSNSVWAKDYAYQGKVKGMPVENNVIELKVFTR